MNEHDNNHVAVAFLCLFKKEGYTGCSRALRCVGGRKKKKTNNFVLKEYVWDFRQ